MKKTLNKVLALVTIVVMLIGMFPIYAFANNGEEICAKLCEECAVECAHEGACANCAALDAAAKEKEEEEEELLKKNEEESLKKQSQSGENIDEGKATLTVKFFESSDKSGLIGELTVKESETIGEEDLNKLLEGASLPENYVWWNIDKSAIFDVKLAVLEAEGVDGIINIYPKQSSQNNPDGGEGAPQFGPLGVGNVDVTYIVDGKEYFKETGLTTGEPLVAPDDPEDIPDGYTSFRGWYVNADGTGEPYVIDKVPENSLTLYAVFSQTYLIRFKDGNLTQQFHYELLPGATIVQPSESQMGLLEYPANHHFLNWYVEGGDPADVYVFGHGATSDLTLVANSSADYLVYFISAGTQVDPQMVTVGNSATQPNDPARVGYDFKYWTTQVNSDGTDAGNYFTTNPAVTDNVVLYATWSPKQVSYSIAIWMEKADVSGTPDYSTNGGLNDYNYITTISTGLIGTAGEKTGLTKDNLPASITRLFAGGNDLLKYGEFQGVVDKELSGTGTTVINLYATRKLYTYVFKLSNDSSTASTNNGRSMTIGGTKYTGASNAARYTIQLKYEQDISGIWPVQGVSFATFSGGFASWARGEGMTWQDTQGIASIRRYLDKGFISKDGQQSRYTVTANWTADDTEYTYRYFADALPGQSGTSVTRSGTKYILMSEYNQGYWGSLGAKYINGFERVNTSYVTYYYITSGNTAGTLTTTKPKGGTKYETWRCFFYTRIEQPLTFEMRLPSGVSGATVRNVPSNGKLKFDESLKNYEPTLEPTINGDKYTFAGWYKDVDYKEKFDWTVNMPQGGLVVYAKWESGEYKVEYYDLTEDPPLIDEHRYAENGFVSHEDVINKITYVAGQQTEGKGVFMGWYWIVNGVKTPYSTEIPVTKDIKLYAEWRTNDFKLTYDAGEGSGTVPVDTHKYALNEVSRVLNGENLIPPTDLVFYGWTVEGKTDGRIYYPGNFITLSGDTTLVAKYASSDDLLTVTYIKNLGADMETYSVSVLKNSVGYLAGEIFTDINSQLIGWSNTSGAANQKDYELNEGDFQFGETDITLYGVWDIKNVEVRFFSTPGSFDPGTTAEFSVAPGTAWENAGIVVPLRDVINPLAGYEFIGWTTVSGGTEVMYADETEMKAAYGTLNNSLDFYAVYREITYYDVNFAVETASAGFGDVSASNVFTVREGSALSSAENWLSAITATPSPATATERYTFVGWYDADGDEVDAAISADFADYIPTGDITFYARFQKINLYSVTFYYLDADGNLITVANTAIDDGTIWNAVVPAIDVPVAGDTNTMIFTSWALAGTSDVYNDAAAIETAWNDAAITKNLVFEAAYLARATNLELTFNVSPADGGYGKLNINGVEKTTETYGSITEGIALGTRTWPTAVTAAADANNSYSFLGWQVEGETGYLSTSVNYNFSDYSITEDTTITAVFSATPRFNVYFEAGTGGNLVGTLHYGPYEGVTEWSDGQIAVPTVMPSSRYTFNGWTLVGDNGAAGTYADGTEILAAWEGQEIDQNLTFTANFVEDEKATNPVRFIVTGNGTIDNQKNPIEYADKYVGDTFADANIVIPAVAADSDNSYFVGWFVGVDSNVPTVNSLVPAGGITYEARFADKTALTITAGSGNFPFKGSAYTANDLETKFTPATLANGDVVTATVDGTATYKTDAGTTTITGYTITRENQDVTGQYAVTLETGKITITDYELPEGAQLVYKWDGDVKEYIGAEQIHHQEAGQLYLRTNGVDALFTLPAGLSIGHVSAIAIGRNVGSYNMTWSDGITLVHGIEDVSGYFGEIAYEAGELEITPAELTLTADAKSVVRGHAAPELTYSISGLVGGDNTVTNNTMAGLEASDILGFVPELATDYNPPTTVGDDAYDIYFTAATKTNTDTPENYTVIFVDSIASPQGGGIVITNSYQVIYHANMTDATGAVPTDATLYAEGEIASVLDNTGNLAYPGLVLIGWSTATDDTGTEYFFSNASNQITMPDSNVDLYGIWDFDPDTGNEFSLTGINSDYKGAPYYLDLDGTLLNGDIVTFYNGATQIDSYTSVNGAKKNGPGFTYVADSTTGITATVTRGGVSKTTNEVDVVIEPATVSVEWTVNAYPVYNGEEQEITATSSHGSVVGDDVIYVSGASGKATYVSPADMDLTFDNTYSSVDYGNLDVHVKITDANDVDVTVNYNVQETVGKYNLIPAEITVTADSLVNAIYDGTAQSMPTFVASYGTATPVNGTAPETDISGLGFTGTHTLNVTMDETITNVSESGKENTIVANSIIDSDNVDVLDNGSIVVSTVNGQFEMETKQIDIEVYVNGTAGGTASKEYDGTPLSLDGNNATLIITGLEELDITVNEDDLFALLQSEQITYADESIKQVPSNIGTFKAAVQITGGDIENFTFEVTPGELEITPAPITIVSDSANKTYDGTALTSGGVTVYYGILDSLAEVASAKLYSTKIQPHTFNADVTGSITNVIDNAANNNTLALNGINHDGGRENVGNSFEVRLLQGTLEIGNRPLYLQGNSATYTADGTTYTVSGYSILPPTADSGLITGDSLNESTVTASASASVAGQYPVVPTAVGTGVEITRASAPGENVVDNYQVIARQGTLTLYDPTPTPLTTYLSYTVNYYAGAITAGGFLGTVAGTAPMGSTIPVTANLYRTTAMATEGYSNGFVYGNLTLTADGQVINVLYSLTPEEEEPPVLPIDEPETPTTGPTEPTETEIEEPETPTVTPATWALLNLILAIVTVIVGIILLIGIFKKNKKDEENADYEGAEDEEKRKSGIVWRIFGIIAAVLAPIVFFLTENMRNPMIFTDKWTLLMGLILLVQVVAMLLMRYVRNKEEDEEGDKENI